MIIELICKYPHEVVMGVAALVGAVIHSAINIHLKEKALPKNKKLVIDYSRIIDTIWQSTLAGVAAGAGLGCNWVGLVTAMITGVGIDKLTNTLKFKGKDILNFAQMIAKLVDSKK